MRVHWIWFAHRPGISDHAKALLLEQFADPEDLYYADGQSIAAISGISQEQQDALMDKNLIPAEEILDACQRQGLQILTYRDAAYPSRLRNISDPPMVLYYKGRIPDWEARPMIGVVGTRKASAYGLTTAKRMGYQIAKCGGIVVSGMAYGIDGMAMAGALTAGMPVVGVLGCGADVVYPKSNRALFADTEQYGCILSEFPPGTPAIGWNFPKRNRIISGLSCGVLVVEAPEKSGALSTARRAGEQGRDVFAVPGNIDNPCCAGSNALLRDGAILAQCGWDVVGEYEAQYPGRVRKDGTPAHMTAYPDEVARAEQEEPVAKVAQKVKLPEKKGNLKKKLGKEAIDKEPSGDYSDGSVEKLSLSSQEQKIVDALEGGEKLVDDVIAQTGLSTGALLSSLTMLELKGVIRRLPGKRIARK